MGNYSLTKAKKGCGLFLIHEHQGEDLFKEMPFLNEFRKEKVFKGVKDKSLRAPKTVKVPSKCVDSQGNQMGLYPRFDTRDLHLKQHFPINSSESRFGPGTYAVGNYE